MADLFFLKREEVSKILERYFDSVCHWEEGGVAFFECFLDDFRIQVLLQRNSVVKDSSHETVNKIFGWLSLVLCDKI